MTVSRPIDAADALRITDRITQIRTTIPDSVRLIAVTKQVSIAAMRSAYAAGIRDFGESKVQEAATKQLALQDLTDITWHLIGHLQTNKAIKAVEQFDWIQSVDSLKLAQRLDALAEAQAKRPSVCLQVKILPDPNKYGFAIEELLKNLEFLDRCTHLHIAGLMVIPPYGLAPDQTRSAFEQARELAEKVRRQAGANLHLEELSMGMSDDYLLAIQAGATMVRLGRILFGDRQ
ncbi:MAG: YggS family pyridoxal phosphate-dependent enzyme [Leptolyngbyaceae cyanobacterium SM1_3_5]|nr:YggS family pyridoxal phosphate-dependent enzyme [Leptolyngbyaceae cyanobacterium SM1_3_5]